MMQLHRVLILQVVKAFTNQLALLYSRVGPNFTPLQSSPDCFSSGRKLPVLLSDVEGFIHEKHNALVAAVFRNQRFVLAPSRQLCFCARHVKSMRGVPVASQKRQMGFGSLSLHPENDML